MTRFGTLRRPLAALGALLIVSAGALSAELPAHAATNAQPNVVPALQTWDGGSGTFTLKASSEIVVGSGLDSVGSQLKTDLTAVTDRTIPTSSGSGGSAGDIVLTLDPSMTSKDGGQRFAEEGYRLTVTADVATIAAPTATGVFYGTRSLLQILMQSASRSTVPVGTSTDWPSYATRGFMLDVGRKFFTPDFIRDYITMMSWYKLNNFQIHLSDNEISPANGDWSKAYTGFRLKSDNPAFAGLASTDGAYDRADWASFESVAAAHAVTIIPEIDAPAHAGAIIKWRPSIGLNGGNSDHLDLSNPDATTTMESIFAEFAPWFSGPDIAFGADEYPAQYAAEFKDYYNTMAGYIRGLGKHPRAWGSFTVMQGNADGYDKDVTINSWNTGYYGLTAADADGFHYINSNDGDLYMVPFATYYHPNGLDNAGLYNNWTPNIGGGQTVPAGSPDGAMFAVWNDIAAAAGSTPHTELEVNKIALPSFAVIAQKTWKASTPTLSYGDFTALTGRVGLGPGITEIAGSSAAPSAGELGFGATVTASSSEPGTAPGNLTDGQALTQWSTTDDTSRLVVDLGQPKTLGSMQTDWTSRAPSAYDVEVSNDGVFWQVVEHHTNSTGAGTDSVDLAGHSARYVALTGITSATGDGVGAWRLSVYPPADLARGGATDSSGVESGTSFTSDLAVDGSSATRWSASYVASPWISVDLGSVEAFDSIRLNWEAASAKDYTIDASTDGTTWKTIAQKSGQATGARDDTVAVSPTSARYVRVTVTAKNLSPYLGLLDFEVHAVAAPPIVLMAAVDPAAPAASGWFESAPQLSLTASGSAKGTAAIQYRFDSGEWKDYTKPVPVDADGAVDIQYRATVGDVTAIGHGTLKVDAHAPTTTITLDPASGAGTVGQPVVAHLKAEDSGSGVASTEYRVDDGSWTAWDGAAITLDQAGNHTVSARSTDGVGHVEDAVTAPFVNAAPSAFAVTIDGGAPSVLIAGSSFTLDVSGARHGAAVSATLHSDPIDLGSARVGEDGTAHIAVTLPENTATGDHELIVDGVDQNGTTVQKTFAVTVQAATTSGSGSDPVAGSSSTDDAALASTGSDAGPALLAALLLLLLGTGAAWAARRARSRDA